MSNVIRFAAGTTLLKHQTHTRSHSYNIMYTAHISYHRMTTCCTNAMLCYAFYTLVCCALRIKRRHMNRRKKQIARSFRSLTFSVQRWWAERAVWCSPFYGSVMRVCIVFNVYVDCSCSIACAYVSGTVTLYCTAMHAVRGFYEWKSVYVVAFFRCSASVCSVCTASP